MQRTRSAASPRGVFREPRAAHLWHRASPAPPRHPGADLDPPAAGPCEPHSQRRDIKSDPRTFAAHQERCKPARCQSRLRRPPPPDPLPLNGVACRATER